MSGEARAAILARVAKATDGVRDPDPVTAHRGMARDYRTSSAALPDEGALEGRLELLEERLVDYGVTVVRTSSDTLATTLHDRLDGLDAQRVVVPHDAPETWREAWRGRVLVAEDGGTFELDEADAAVTACAVAVAETGSIVLDGGSGQGRRAASLIPDVHLCIVAASQVVTLVPEAVERLGAAARDGAAFTWISGPSATSDIELVRVAGVHGPRTLLVLLVTDA